MQAGIILLLVVNYIQFRVIFYLGQHRLSRHSLHQVCFHSAVKSVQRVIFSSPVYAQDDDQPLGQFFRRRFGAEVAENLR